MPHTNGHTHGQGREHKKIKARLQRLEDADQKSTGTFPEDVHPSSLSTQNTVTKPTWGGKERFVPVFL